MNRIQRKIIWLVSKHHIAKHLVFAAAVLFAGGICFVSGLLKPFEVLSTIVLLIVLWGLANLFSKLKPIITNILLIVISSLFTIGLVDLGYHLYLIYKPKPPGERIESEVETIYRFRPLQLITDSARCGDLAEMGLLTKEFPETRKIICQIDELGYRNPIGQKDKKNRIIIIGDSYGFGSMSDGENIADVFRQRGLETYNLSLPGYGPWQEFYTLRHEIDKINKADTCTVVWLLFAGNDLAGRFDSVNVADRKTNWRNDFYTFRKQSPVRNNIATLINPKAQADTNVAISNNVMYYKPYMRMVESDSLGPNAQKYIETMKSGISWCKAHGLDLQIAVCPTKEEFINHGFVDGHEIEMKYITKINGHYNRNYYRPFIVEALRNCCTGCEYTIDLSCYLSSDTHFNKKGNMMMGNIIYEKIFPIYPPIIKELNHGQIF